MNSKAMTLKELQQDVDFTQHELSAILNKAISADVKSSSEYAIKVTAAKEAARKAKEALRIFSYRQHQSFTQSGRALRK